MRLGFQSAPLASLRFTKKMTSASFSKASLLAEAAQRQQQMLLGLDMSLCKK